mmetsp:Transcript_43859/g.103720  ORF Transcript_43859/g.103720 Transcript_43859/m.103720 type:complete len:211 (+) Transcript_43859:126-758(+)
MAAAVIGVRMARARRNSGQLMSGSFAPSPLSRADRDRVETMMEEQRRRGQLKTIIKAYDVNRSGKLERDQLKKLLTDIESGTPEGSEPTEEEIDWIIRVADRGKDDCIQLDELGEAISCWKTYLKKKPLLEEKLAKYDVDKTGTLSKQEIKAYLTDLNGGIEVTDDEVDMVMADADVMGDGVIRVFELQRAATLWYSYVQEHKSGCCVIS